MKSIIKLLSIAVMLSSIISVNFAALDSRASELGSQSVHAQSFSGEDLDKAVEMALLDEGVTKLSIFLETLNYKPQISDAVAVKVTWSDKSGQSSVTGVGLAFKNNEDNATIVCMQQEEGSRTLAFTYHKSNNGTIVTAYRIDQDGTVIALSGIWDCIACAACVVVAIVIVVGCISTCFGIVPCVIACVLAATGVTLSEACVHACIECYKSVGGVSVSVDKFSLLAPYAICSIFITIATVSMAARKKKQEEQDVEPESQTKKCSSADLERIDQ